MPAALVAEVDALEVVAVLVVFEPESVAPAEAAEEALVLAGVEPAEEAPEASVDAGDEAAELELVFAAAARPIAVCWKVAKVLFAVGLMAKTMPFSQWFLGLEKIIRNIRELLLEQVLTLSAGSRTRGVRSRS